VIKRQELLVRGLNLTLVFATKLVASIEYISFARIVL
jgi:hypothetical protein